MNSLLALLLLRVQVTNFEIFLKVTGVSMVFEFDQWFEAESSYVVEEWGMGTFTLKNMTLTLLLEPYIHQEKFRIKIKEHQLQIVDYEYKLNTKEQS